MVMQHREVADKSAVELADEFAVSDELLDEIIAENSHMIEQQNWDTYFSFGKTVGNQYLLTVLSAVTRSGVEISWKDQQFCWRRHEDIMRDDDSCCHKGIDSLIKYLQSRRLL
ncbi:MAG: hypothetical protein KTR32_31590 [Granulosicoccus sp.]|nr:hypothetical protein [Granulosicoccus sp.]